ncbi:hypothetical protein [Sinomicrobium weinanense]|uniref:Protein CcmA, bactofilin family n=1 Tax=Sinomicrobium weinanense TaxID=2842200 RepID=A0A926JPX4_9FLAO|nr:hypothetical protein [Sinomicrobium weinanense]MBC9795081.1 hypothetical protein [Sinomicrobium weinanense]MBU3123788.1 hypothetical protein [Sinomicrobium weinanense]
MSDLPIKKLKDIRHLLPADCWFAQCNEATGEFNEDKVAHLVGNRELETLDLDFFEREDEDVPVLVLVEGNLQIRNIHNRETDGAAGLIVLGDLAAENIVVGGQEIYVTGNLNVSGLYWGDYNHGSLVVQGTIGINVFLSTDYDFDHRRFQEGDRVNVTHFLWDDREDEFDRDRLVALFEPNCLLDEGELVDDPYSFKDWLNPTEILERLDSGEQVLLKNPREYNKEGKDIPFVFESPEFNDRNLQRLRKSPLFLDHIPSDAEDRTQVVEYWRNHNFKRVLVTKDRPGSEVVYFQKGDQALVIAYEEQKPGFLRRFAGNSPALQITIQCRTIIRGQKPQWYDYNPELPEHQKFKSLTQPMWEDLLNEWSEMEYWCLKFRETVTLEKAEDILALPLVREKYSDYYNEDADQLWFGNANWQFRQADNSWGRCPRISILRQIHFEGDEGYDEKTAFEFFHYDLKTLENGVTAVILCTQGANGYDSEPYRVPPAETEKYRKAIRYFQQLEERIFRLNDTYTIQQ